MLQALRRTFARVPWIVWAVLAPAVILGALRLRTGGGMRVLVVGAGAVSELRAEDAPPGAYYKLDTRRVETTEATAKRIEATLTAWPELLVVGFADWGANGARIRPQLERLGARTADMACALVVVGPNAPGQDPDGAGVSAPNEDQSWWRQTFCQQGRMRVCVEPSAAGSDKTALRAAVGGAVQQALALHEQWRASTQVNRP